MMTEFIAEALPSTPFQQRKQLPERPPLFQDAHPYFSKTTDCSSVHRHLLFEKYLIKLNFFNEFSL